MDDRLPTPEELGERLKKGEITEAQAIEIMSERARREAFASMFNPNAKAENETAPREKRGMQKRQVLLLAAVIVIIIVIACLL